MAKTDISVVVPAKNEAENLPGLIAGIQAALSPTGHSYEIIIVDDGSTDNSIAVLTGLKTEVPMLRLLQHGASGGQSAGVHSGVTFAQGRVIATLDGDGQNPPSELPKLVAPLFAVDASERLALVAGQRVKRQDTWSKRMASKFANALRSWMLKDQTRDTGCGLKAFRRDVYLTLPYFDHMHRYLPALFGRDGWAVAHVDVAHQERGAGNSNYSNFQRAMVGAVDLLAVAWLIRRRKKASPVEI